MSNANKNKYGFEPSECDCCGQQKTYLLPIDWGTATIVKAVARAVSLKGINVIHPTKEMEVPHSEWSYTLAINEGKLTSTQIGNFSRAKAHGLIARYRPEPGNWLLTSKGAKFLRGEAIQRLRIRNKKGVTDTLQDKYWKPEEYRVTIHEVVARGSKYPVWEGIDFDVVEGRIVRDIKQEDGKTVPLF